MTAACERCGTVFEARHRHHRYCTAWCHAASVDFGGDGISPRKGGERAPPMQTVGDPLSATFGG
jgi:hypothetical protein